MLIYADDVYKFPIASKGAYDIYFVFYMTWCWISSRAPYENCFREVAPQCFLLQLKSASKKFGREVAPLRFHFQSKSTSHTEVAPLDFFFRTEIRFLHYRRGGRSRHIGPEKESHVLSTYKRQEHMSKTREKREQNARNMRETCEFIRPPITQLRHPPSLKKTRVLPVLLSRKSEDLEGYVFKMRMSI